MGLDLFYTIGKNNNLVFQIPFSVNSNDKCKFTIGFSTDFMKNCANQYFITTRIFDMEYNNIEFTYNLGFVGHNGSLGKKICKRTKKKNRILRNIDDLGSRFMFKHIVTITGNKSTTLCDNNDMIFLYGSHSSNWGENTAYFGSDVKENAGIDIGGGALNISNIFNRLVD